MWESAVFVSNIYTYTYHPIVTPSFQANGKYKSSIQDNDTFLTEGKCVMVRAFVEKKDSIFPFLSVLILQVSAAFYQVFWHVHFWQIQIFTAVSDSCSDTIKPCGLKAAPVVDSLVLSSGQTGKVQERVWPGRFSHLKALIYSLFFSASILLCDIWCHWSFFITFYWRDS